MALGWDQIFAQAEMRDWVERAIRSPVMSIRVAPPSSPDETFTFEHHYGDHHEAGEAMDIAIPQAQTHTVMIIDDPMAASIDEIAMRERVYEWYAETNLAIVGTPLPPATIARGPLLPDRPPALAAPSSRLPSYRPR